MRNSGSFLERRISNAKRVLPGAMLGLGSLVMGGCAPSAELINNGGNSQEEKRQVVEVPSSGSGSYVKNEGGNYFFKQGGGEIGQGDIIVGTGGEGFLRMVTSSPENVGDLVRVNTRQASIAEAVESGSFSFDSARAKLDNRSIKSRVLNWSVDIEETIKFEEDSDVTIEGDGRINLDFNLDFKVEDYQLKKFYSSLEGMAEGSIHFSGNIGRGRELNERFDLGNKKWYWLGSIGGLPVVTVAELEADLVLEGIVEINSGFFNEVSGRGNVEIGAKYDGKKWDGINKNGMDIFFSTVGGCMQGETKLEASLDIEADVRLYGVIGPYGGIQTYAGLKGGGGFPCDSENVEISLLAANWRFYGGLRAPWGVDVEIFDRSIVGYRDRDLFNGRLEYTFAEKESWVEPTEELIYDRFDSREGWDTIEVGDGIIGGGGSGGGSSGGGSSGGGSSGGGSSGGGSSGGGSSGGGDSGGGSRELYESEPNNSRVSADNFSLSLSEHVVHGTLNDSMDADYFEFNYPSSEFYGYHLTSDTGTVGIFVTERDNGIRKAFVHNEEGVPPASYELRLVRDDR